MKKLDTVLIVLLKLAMRHVEFCHDNAVDLMKLLFFNDPIPSLHTHNYGFHTATGRHIIETIKEYYYEYKN